MFDTRCRPWYIASVLNNAYGQYKDKVYLGAPYKGGTSFYVTISKFQEVKGKHAVLGVDLNLNW